MFKDYDKYLSTSLKVYLFVLIIIFILKLVGLDYFYLDVDSPLIIKLNSYFYNLYIQDIWYLSTLLFYTYVTISISCNNKNCLKYTFITAPITYLVHYSKYLLNLNPISIFIDFIYLFLLSFIFYKLKKNKDTKKFIKRFIIYNILSIFIQLISYVTRYKYNIEFDYGFIVNFLLNLDYLIMTIIIYKIYFMKGVEHKCIYQMEVGSFSLKKLNLKNLLKKSQKNWHNFKSYDKVTKLTIIIYTIFSLIWNTLSVVLILLVARLNDTFIECIFILTSFWLSKHSFGKPFHFKSMSQCFIVSNLSYYILNRVTTPLGISIIVPILLGVGLSYVTSKLVKKVYKPLYRGMPEDLFEETILKVVDKDCLKYKICYDFYMNKKSVISLALKYNYTEAGIRKIKDRVNDKIKRLN